MMSQCLVPRLPAQNVQTMHDHPDCSCKMDYIQKKIIPLGLVTWRMPCSTAFNADMRLCASNGVWLYRQRQTRGAGSAYGAGGAGGQGKAATSPRHDPAHATTDKRKQKTNGTPGDGWTEENETQIFMRSAPASTGVHLVDYASVGSLVGPVLGVVGSHLHAIGALFGPKPQQP